MQAQTERDRLVETHLDYARKLTLKVFKELGQPKTVDVDDLLAYGANGLVEAAGRFDPTRGVAFTTFSYYRIRGAVFDGLRKIGWLSRGMARLAARAGTNAYLGNLADREGGETAGRQTTAQAAEDLANTLDNVATIFLTSMDGVNDAEMPDENATAPDEDLHKHQVQSAIREAMKRFDGKVADAALALGISKATLYENLYSYGLRKRPRRG